MPLVSIGKVLLPIMVASSEQLRWLVYLWPFAGKRRYNSGHVDSVDVFLTQGCYSNALGNHLINFLFTCQHCILYM